MLRLSNSLKTIEKCSKILDKLLPLSNVIVIFENGDYGEFYKTLCIWYKKYIREKLVK